MGRPKTVALSKEGALEAGRLRARIIRSFRQQGFKIRKGLLVPPGIDDKDQLRSLHLEAVKHNVERSRPGLKRHEDRLLKYVASGTEVTPQGIRPRLVQVHPGSEHELLFRYVRLHWSVPVSAGYGRRLRFVIYDESNGKVMGVFGLGDPVFGLGPRDRWIGWSPESKKKRLQCVMDLFVLGAVPPYSYLLGGKLAALLSTSRDVQEEFRRKYGGRKAYISGEPLDGRLALLTTNSALGRSSLYNRLRYGGQQAFQRVGYTRGSGDFHFSNGFYDDLRKFALEYCDATAKHADWGDGFRNRRELVRKTLPLLDLPRELLYHGVKREIFVAPLAENTREFLKGDDQRLKKHDRAVNELFERFRARWLLPRAERDSRYLHFDRESYRLWGSE